MVVFGSRLVYSSAVREQKLMGDDTLTITWNDDTYYTLPVFASVIVDGVRYELFSPYKPEVVSEGEFKYSPVFQHHGKVLGKTPFLLDTYDAFGNAISEPEWSYTGSAITIANKIADYINGLNDDLGLGEDWTAEVDDNLVASATCDFSDSDVLSALGLIADAFDTEWAIDFDAKVVKFGFISEGEGLVTLAIGDNVSLSSSPSEEDYFNAFLVRGGTRNVSQQTASGGNVSASTRLRLDATKYPDGIIYTANGTFSTKEEFDASRAKKLTEVLKFDDVYPHVDLYVYNPRKRVRVLKDSDGKPVVKQYGSDGKPIYKQYAIWYVRLAYMIKDGDTTTWKDYELDVEKQVLPGYTLQCSYGANEKEGAFSSPLAGREFEMTYHTTGEKIPQVGKDGSEDYDSGVEIIAGDYEIIYEEENDLIIPTMESEGLIPLGATTPNELCNKLVLFNIAMGEAEVESAKNELEDTAKQYIVKLFSDLNEYTLNSNPVSFNADNPKLFVGEKITLRHIDGTDITTRVTGLSYDIDSPLEQTITVANEVKKGTVSELKDDVRKIVAGGGAGGGSLSTAQMNKFIRNYGDANYLSKVSDDTAQGVITHQKAPVLERGLQTSKWQQGVSGGALWQGDGGWHIEADYINVRKKLETSEVEIAKTTHVGGRIIASPASLVISSVELVSGAEDVYRCYFVSEDANGNAITNTFATGDQAYCETFNLSKKGGTAIANHYWWALVVGVGTNYIDVSTTDHDSASDAPMAGDNVVALGNRHTTARQNAIIIASAGTGNPYIRIHKGINTYRLDNTIVAQISPTSTFINTYDEAINDITKSAIAAGIDLNGLNSTITLSAKTTKVTEDLETKRLLTTSQSGGAHIEAFGSQINVYGASGYKNIVFGVGDNGYAVMQYYDNDGHLLYDLGPGGLSNINISNDGFTEMVLKMLTDGEFDDDVQGLFNALIKHQWVWAMLTLRSEITEQDPIYRYRARRVNTAIVGGNYATATEAKLADGRYYVEDGVQIDQNAEASGIYVKQGLAKFTNIDEVSGVIPSDYTTYEEYYASIGEEVRWDILDEDNPIYTREVYCLVAGRIDRVFNFYWQ